MSPVSGQQQLPDGYEDDLVAAVPFPTAMAGAPDGRMLIATQHGQVYVLEAAPGWHRPMDGVFDFEAPLFARVFDSFTISRC